MSSGGRGGGLGRRRCRHLDEELPVTTVCCGSPGRVRQKICQQMAALHCTGWVRPTNGWVETGTHPAQSRCAASDITTSQAETDILASYRLNATPTSPKQ
jgi:hypothetical protein